MHSTSYIIHTSGDNSWSRSNGLQSANKKMKTASQYKARAPSHQQCYDGQHEAWSLVTWASC